jgi:hypothetical protein
VPVPAADDDPRDDDPENRDPDKAPEIPPDEPRPPEVQDPPSEPGRKGPYVVMSSAEGSRGKRTEAER